MRGNACVVFPLSSSPTAFLFEIQEVVDSVVNSRKLWFFKNPCGYLRYRLLPTGYKSHQNAVHGPAPFFSSFQQGYRSLQLLAHLNDREFSKQKGYFSDSLSVVNLQRKSWIIIKTYFQIKFISSVSTKCQKTEPKSKNPIKFADIHRSDALIKVRSIKFNLDAVVSGSCFELMLSMKEHTTTDREIISRKIFI